MSDDENEQKFIPKTRKQLLMEIDVKFQEVFGLIADYIEFKTNEANIEGGTIFGGGEDEEDDAEIEVESDEDGDYLDGDGNIYNVETSEIIGKKITIRKKDIKTFRDEEDEKHFIDKDGNIYDIESSPPKVIGKKDLKTGEKTMKNTLKSESKIASSTKASSTKSEPKVASSSKSTSTKIESTSDDTKEKKTASKTTKTTKPKAPSKPKTTKAKKDEIRDL